MPHTLPGPDRTPSQTALRLPLLRHFLSRQPSPASSASLLSDRRPRRLSLITVLCGIALATAACHGGDDAKKAGGPGGAMPPLPVTVVKVARQSLPVRLAAPGQAEGSREVEVRARVSGILERKLFDEGDVVKANAPMYQIDRAPLEIALAQAKAQLAQTQAQYENARREEARLKPLAAGRAVSQREYDNAVATLRGAEASRAAGQSRIRDAELNLSYSTVRAPIDGVTGRSLKSEGSLITIGSDSLLTTISTVNPIWVRFGLSEADHQRLQAGKIESVRIVDSTGKPLIDNGELNFSSTTIDNRLGTLQLRASFTNPERRVLPGQFVQVEIAVGGREAWTVPQQAVIQSDQGRMVWVVGDDSKVAPRPIKVAEWIGKDWVVTDGLKDGDQVVIDNLFKIRPGAPVAPHLAGQNGGAPGGAASAPGGGAGAEPKKAD